MLATMPLKLCSTLPVLLRLLTPLKRLVCYLTLALSALNVQAETQNPNALKAYHIEMVIFERANSAFKAPEAWPQNLVLAYPPNYRVIQPHANNTDADNTGKLALATTTDEVNATPAGAQSALSFSERILWQRPKDTYLLKPQAYAIQRKNSLRILFHKAWEQTLDSTAKAPAIIINGGDTFDERTELGGTIRVSVNKFIHVDTQLWLARFTPNYGQALEWPIPPLAPTVSSPHVTVAAGDGQPNGLALNSNIYNSASNDINNDNIDNNVSNNPTIELSPPSNHSQGSNIYRGTVGVGSNAVQTRLGGNIFNEQTFNTNAPSADIFNSRFGSAEHTANLKFLTDQVVMLKQSRRMRSQELHYIDHPRLGILVKVVAIDQKE